MRLAAWGLAWEDAVSKSCCPHVLISVCSRAARAWCLAASSRQLAAGLRCHVVSSYQGEIYSQVCFELRYTKRTECRLASDKATYLFGAKLRHSDRARVFINTSIRRVLEDSCCDGLSDCSFRVSVFQSECHCAVVEVTHVDPSSSGGCKLRSSGDMSKAWEPSEECGAFSTNFGAASQTKWSLSRYVGRLPNFPRSCVLGMNVWLLDGLAQVNWPGVVHTMLLGVEEGDVLLLVHPICTLHMCSCDGSASMMSRNQSP